MYNSALEYLHTEFPLREISRFADYDSVSVSQCSTLKEIKSQYNDFGVSNWLGEVVQYICTASSIGVDETRKQIASQSILSRFGTLKPSELLWFVNLWLGGEYGRFYNAQFDVQVLTKALQKFKQERIDEAHAFDEEQPTKPKKDGKECFSEYLMLLQKAVYEDIDAMVKLQLNSYKEVLNCCAICVARGDFPSSILDLVRDEYKEYAWEMLDKAASYLERADNVNHKI